MATDPTSPPATPTTRLRRQAPVAIPLVLGVAVQLTGVVSHTIGYILFGIAGIWLFVLVPAVATRLPSLVVERGDGLAVRVRRPVAHGKRGLRQQTTALVADIWAFAKQQAADPDSAAWREMTRRSQAATDEGEKRRIWDAYTDAMQQRYFLDSRELAERFGGRARALVAEYHRRGLLTDQDAHRLLWQCQSMHWIATEAAPRLEALALML